MDDYRDITLGDLILYSTYAKKEKIYFDLETFKKLFDSDVNDIDYDKIFKIMVTVFKELPGDKVQLNLKTQDYEPIVLKLFSEKIRKSDAIDWIIKEYGQGIIPSEKFLKNKKKLKGGVLPIRIPDDLAWILEVLEKNSKEKYGRKNKSLYALNILKEALKHYAPKDKG